MKCFFILFGVVCAGGPWLHAQSPLERELTQLRDQRSKAITAAVEPINQRYQTSLEQLLRRATQANELDVALAARRELQLLTGKPPSATEAATPAVAAEPSPARPVIVPADASVFKGKWYRVYRESVAWEGARQRCEALGGQLAVVPDAETWAFLEPLSKKGNLWLGASDEKTEGQWRWIDGKRVTFTTWHASQPDDKSHKQNFLRTDNGRWDDFGGSANGFICEWK